MQELRIPPLFKLKGNPAKEGYVNGEYAFLYTLHRLR
jgi:hypothetical protein